MAVLVKRHPDQLPTGYPVHLEEEVMLPNGELLWVRPLVPEDAAALAAEFAAVDDDTVYMRFFNPHFRLTADRLRYLTEVDYHHHLALAAMIRRGNVYEGVAIARYVERTADDVEGAIVVKPDYRRLGIAGLLLERLADIAAGEGYRTMSASYLESNAGAASLLAACGFGEPTIETGVAHSVRQLMDAVPAG
ncbi:MAG: GNAT family N-acetyltransferase [Acidimicrobiia bacterium]|nr:GNAT family N-acetyltransferase [Acidimicrobiia bacterium]